jgi:hypothetical protein
MYAFSPDSRCFVYIDEMVDGDLREYPEINVLSLTSYRDVRWKTRKDFMLFLAGYGLLDIFREKEKEKETSEGETVGEKIEVVEEKRGLVESEESSRVQMLFRVLYCPNLIEHIVSYL